MAAHLDESVRALAGPGPIVDLGVRAGPDAFPLVDDSVALATTATVGLAAPAGPRRHVPVPGQGVPCLPASRGGGGAEGIERVTMQGSVVLRAVVDARCGGDDSAN